MKRLFRKKSLILAGLLSLSLLVGCGSSDNEGGQAKEKETVRIGGTSVS